MKACPRTRSVSRGAPADFNITGDSPGDDSSLRAMEQETRRRQAPGVPGEILYAQTPRRPPVLISFPTLTADVAIVAPTSDAVLPDPDRPQPAERDGLHERRGGKVLGLVRREPAVAASAMIARPKWKVKSRTSPRIRPRSSFAIAGRPTAPAREPINRARDRANAGWSNCGSNCSRPTDAAAESRRSGRRRARRRARGR